MEPPVPEREREITIVLLLLTRFLIFQRSNMADAHEDEETVIEEEYKVCMFNANEG